VDAETFLQALVRVNLVANVAILLVLLLRPFVLRWFGAHIAWWLWLVVPIAAAASFVPAPEQIVLIQPSADLTSEQVPTDLDETPKAGERTSVQAAPMIQVVTFPAVANVLVALWLAVAAALLARSIIGTRRAAADPALGPALVGVLRPRLVLPADFATRFDAQERALILAHEEVHRVSGHTLVNALVELARCSNWFNPLVHVAAAKIRTDQELACDATVVAAHPTARHVYAQALLKARIFPDFLPLGCTWTSRSGERLAQRIEMLARPSLTRRGAAAGATAIAVACLAVGYAAWAQQPAEVVTQSAPQTAVWTPTADAPAGVLSHALEGQRHDFFIELAQQGDIDLVFFGTTTTEMWWWDRGESVWQREFGELKAANFGSQGTQADSLVWRMQNGELDGYRAKLVVLNAFGRAAVPLSPRSRFPDSLAGYAAIIAEIRARQPQAKILLLAAFPRSGTLPQWQEVAAADAAAFANLVDDETVFYADIGARFFRPDGTYNGAMWGFGQAVGAQPPLFEVWAEELQPWLDRFVR
jgi:beta-lactamase regulating signal transducer with metallopeptidase domain